MTVAELAAALSRLPPDAPVARAGPVFMVPVSRVGTHALVPVLNCDNNGCARKLRPAEPWDDARDRLTVVVIA